MAGESGIVFNIQRFSLHDGPGIRTTVFLKGCNLRCAWCHNPESFRMEPQLSVAMGKCTLCGACAVACPNGVHAIAGGAHRLSLAACTRCWACTAVCPADAISIIGRRYTVDEVLAVVSKDRRYYESSGGGVTFSGGEPTLQHAFLLGLLEQSRALGLHTCLETNGHLDPERLEQLIPLVDLFLYDYKVTDDALSLNYVGATNTRPLQGLRLLDEHGKPIILRCPIIPGINDSPEHFEAIRALQASHPSIQRVELMPYHNVGSGKWENIGMQYTLDQVQLPSPQQIKLWEAGK